MVTRAVVIEFSDATYEKLENYCTIEELNKSTVVNRAVQTYAYFRDLQRSGMEMYIREPMTGKMEKVTIQTRFEGDETNG